MLTNYGKYLLSLTAFVAFATALMHMSCIVLGPECYAWQMAPPQIVESAQEGTLLAPLGTTFVSAIFALWGLYALSAAGVIRRLPLLKLGIYAISALCMLRGILGIQLWLRHPELVATYSFVSNWVWFVTGLLFFLGYRNVTVMKP